MFHVALTPVTVALAGIPATVRLELTPFGVLSGTGILITPELTVTEPGTGGGVVAVLNAVPLIPGTPPHTGPAGVMVTTGLGLTVKVAQLETLVGGMNGVQVPLTMQRYP
jgi:hypothetical protein